MDMETTKSLASTIAALTAHYNPGPHVRDAFARVLAADNACSLRRASVLKHDDLRRLLTMPPLDYPRADMWNGWIPPAWVNLGEPELCRVNGDKLNQLGSYSAGEQRNDSPRRAALIEIITEAWRREQAPDGSLVTVQREDGDEVREPGADDAGHEPDVPAGS